MIENNTPYTILVKYALFCFALPRVFIEDKEGSDVPWKDGNKHKEWNDVYFKKREITRIMANVKPGKSCKSLFKKLQANA